MTESSRPSHHGLGANPSLSLLSRWKIFDNLRRSVVALGMVVMLASAWLIFPETVWIVTLASTVLLFIPPLFNAALNLVRKDAGQPPGQNSRRPGPDTFP